MTEEPANSGRVLEQSKPALFVPHRIALVTLWILAVVCLAMMLIGGVRHTYQYHVERYIPQVAYALALLWYLSRTGPSIEQLPDIGTLLLPRWRVGESLPVIAILIVLALEFYARGISKGLMIVATIWILIVWRRGIGFHSILLGLGVIIVAFLGGLPFFQNQLIPKTGFVLLLLLAIPMFVTGGMLSKRTGLVGSQVYSGQYTNALRSFLMGCLLFIPFGLLNAVNGSPGKGLAWVTHWWMTLSLPWFSGIVEEIWFRLFLVTLCYFMLRPAFNRAPIIAVALSVLFSGISFGLGHSGDLMDRFLTTGLLYGVPMAAIYVRRDWEHAVGAHYMVNMIPWVMVFLEN